jgi:two-component system response regulator NreC
VCPHQETRNDKKITCVLVTDHVLLRQGVRRLLEDESDIEVLAEAGSAPEALRSILENQPDVVIADTSLFGRDHDVCVHAILEKSPVSRVLPLMVNHGGSLSADRKISSRILRSTSASELIALVKTPSSALSSSRERLSKKVAEWPSKLLPRQRSLTVRERQVLKLLAEGRTVRSVAAILGLSVKTVDAHKFNLMRKLNIHNKAELVMWAIQEKILKLPVNL